VSDDGHPVRPNGIELMMGFVSYIIWLFCSRLRCKLFLLYFTHQCTDVRCDETALTYTRLGRPLRLFLVGPWGHNPRSSRIAETGDYT